MATSASRSAALVAACRLLAHELGDPERLISDPFARLFVDDAAIAAARAQPELRCVIRLRTRYIDDAVLAFAAQYPQPQVLLLGAGLDARAFRLDLDADVFEVDFPATLDDKQAKLDGAVLRPLNRRVVVPVDLASQTLPEPLVGAGFDRSRPTIVVWEGVIMYLSNTEAEAVLAQLASLLAPDSELVADYGERGWRRPGRGLVASGDVEAVLAEGGEPLRAGLRDAAASLAAAGFDVLDDEAIEWLAPRYGLPPVERYYPGRIFHACIRSVDAPSSEEES
jgi:methyltransferase (TIGR00027 family)